MLRSNDEYADKTKVLSSDERVLLHRELQEDLYATKTLLDLLNEESGVDQQLAYSILYMKESRLVQFCKVLGIELDSVTERESRYADIRIANAKIRRLEAEMGAQVNATQVKSALEVLSDKVEHWWDVEGFGHISDISFTKYGSMKLTLSCHLFSHTRVLFIDKPVSQKEAYAAWIQGLKDKGFELVDIPGERDPELVDCDGNRRLIEAIISKAFPTARISSTSNHYNHRHLGGISILKDVSVYVHTLREVEELPNKPTIE